MSRLRCALVPEMELRKNGHTFFFVFAAGAITSGWWARWAARVTNIFNHCHKRKKGCQSEFIYDK